MTGEASVHHSVERPDTRGVMDHRGRRKARFSRENLVLRTELGGPRFWLLGDGERYMGCLEGEDS